MNRIKKVYLGGIEAGSCGRLASGSAKVYGVYVAI